MVNVAHTCGPYTLMSCPTTYIPKKTSEKLGVSVPNPAKCRSVFFILLFILFFILFFFEAAVFT